MRWKPWRGHQHFYERRGKRDRIDVACFGCGKTREMGSEPLERLKGRIERDCDIKITVVRTEIGGYGPKWRPSW